MSAYEMPKQHESSQQQQNEIQHPSNRGILFVQPNGTIAQAQNTSRTSATSSPQKRIDDETEILRFRESERLLHWAIAIPFMICWATALILILVYNPDPSRPYRPLFAALHRFSGVCLVFLPLFAIFTKRKDIGMHLYNIKHAWFWSLADLKWLLLMGIAAVNKKTVLPKQGKFNAAEKVNFIIVMVTWPVFVVTGIFMFIQDVPWFAWLIHVCAAILASPTMLGHIYMATVNPDTRTGISGMISGYVNRHWAQHHYARWYDEQQVPPKIQSDVHPRDNK